ncbi:MAG: hypothetical protein ACI3ZS_03325 [Candidatus Cryptobacteroides sp.]
MKPVEIEFLMRNKTKSGFAEVRSDASATERDVQAMQAQLNELMAEYQKLHALIKENPKMDQSENIAMLDALQDKMEELQTQLRKAGVEIEDFGKTMPNTPVMPKGLPKATQQFNGLHMSIQQIAREMPSLAMGPQMFFLAISNNLPILADNIALARKEYDALIASGQKGVPVWKQIVKSLFSWQTALTTGIMLLVMYGKDIAKWAKEVFVGKTALDELRESMQKTYEVEKSAQEVAAKTRFEMTQTMNRIKEFNGTRAEERRLVDELNGKYGESFGYFQTLAQWYDTLSEKAETYTRVLFLQSKQESLMQKALEADDKVHKIESETDSDYDTWWGYGGKVDRFFSSDQSYKNSPNGKRLRQQALRDAKAERDAIFKEIEALFNEEIDLTKSAGIGAVIDGSLRDIENAIAAKRKELSQTTNNDDYNLIMEQIRALEKRKAAITGEKSDAGNVDDTNIRNAERLGELELAARRAVEDQVIALEKEGYARERAEADLAFEREKERLLAEKAEFLRIYDELEKAGYKVDPAQKQRVSADYDLQIVNAGALRDREVAEINAREKKQTDDHIADLLGKYQDYATRRKAIEEKYRADIAELEAKKASGAIKGEDADAAIAEAQRQKNAELDKLDKEISNSAKDSSAMLQAVFSNATSQSKKEIENVIEYAQKLIKLLDGTDTSDKLGFTDEQIEAMAKDSELIQQLFQKIIDKKEELYGRGGYAAQFIGGIKQIRDALKMTDQEQKTAGINAGMNQMVQSGMAINSCFAQMADSLSEIAELSGDEHLGEVADAMQKATDTMSSTIEGAAAGAQIGGVYGAIAGAALGLIKSVATMAIEAEEKSWAALVEVNRARLDYQRQYNLLLLEQKLLLEEASYVFGEKEIAKAANAMQVYKEAMADFKKEMNNVSLGHPTRRMTQGIYTATERENMQKGIAGLANAAIVTGHEKTGLFGWGKGRDVYSSILDVYPELIDANGELDTAMLQTILDTQKMSDETRAYLENLIDLKDMMDEADAALEDYLSSTFGSLGSAAVDAIKQYCDAGENYMVSFAESTADSLEGLFEDLAYSLFFADKFSQLENDLKAIYDGGKSEEQIAMEQMNILEDFYNSMGGTMEDAANWMEDVKKMAAEKGFELWNESGVTQTGKTGGVETMTVDQGNKLEGLWTATVQHVASADLKLDNVTESLGRSLEYQQRTADNTDSLPLIYALLEAVKRDGLKVK